MREIIAIGGSVLAVAALWVVGLGLHHKLGAPEWLAAAVALAVMFWIFRQLAKVMNWLDGI